jgi:catechol 2,3-dioxygenase-like lactoylglutathione lyase family enzyme
MRITGTHHISLRTPNFARLREFYVSVLGMRVAGGFAGENIIFLDAGNVLIELEEQGRPEGARSARGGAGWNHLALQVDDVDAAFRHLSGLGVPFQAEPTNYPEGAGVMRIAFLTDPDGNIIELLQPLTGELPHG